MQDKFTFSEIIPEIVSQFASNNALSFIDESPVTYSQMGKQIEAVIAFAENLGLEVGDKAAILSQNMPNWGISYFALQCMGIIAVPILPDFSPKEIQNVLNHSESKGIFVSKSLEFKLDEIETEKLKSIIRLDDFSVLKSPVVGVSFDADAKPEKLYKTNPDDIAVLLYTSGTTGESKGVMLSQKNIISNAIQSGNVQEIDDSDRFLSILPLSHTYENTIGLVLPIMKGASITYLKKLPTATVLVPAMKKLKPSFMLTVPMIIEKVYRNSILPQIEAKATTRFLHKFATTRKLLYFMAGKKLYQTFGGNLKFFGIGGAKLDGQVEQFLRDAKFPYAIGYGLTETAPLLAGSNPNETKLQAIGPKVINCELKINNPDPVTGEGEIWAKGPNVMLGYYKNEEKTKEVLTDDGWFKTGDLGVFDNDGWLSHKGRLKNMIVGANGENIYPEEIESVINNFKHVVESVVVEKKGKLVAMVHFDREELEKKLKTATAEFAHLVEEKFEEISHKVDDVIEELSKELHTYVNSRVNKFSKIQQLVVQPIPFEKTATKKIKRYLYY